MNTKNYKKYVITLLLMVYIFNFIDRQILSILMEPIKVDLGLSDTQLGLLSGLAFALFYTTLGIPIASFADRSNRVNIISVSLVIWSALTAACGMATSFIQLFLFRLGVGVGEAGCTPPAHSIISDYFSRKEMPSVISIYMLGIPIGIMLGMLLGGYVNQYYGWRMTFVIVGLPGIALAVLLKFTLKEPTRKLAIKEANDSTNQEKEKRQLPIKEVFKCLWKNKTFRHLVIGQSLVAWIGFGVTQWYAAYIIRRYGMSTGELGLWSAFIYGGGMTLGIYLGGFFVKKYGAKTATFQTKMCTIGLLIALPFYILVLTVADAKLSLMLMIPTFIFLNLCTGPTFALFQTLANSNMKAMGTAVALLVINLIGMGLGPLMVGYLSDQLTASMGSAEGLRIAMLSGLSVLLWAAYHYRLAGKTIESDLEAATMA